MRLVRIPRNDTERTETVERLRDAARALVGCRTTGGLGAHLLDAAFALAMGPASECVDAERLARLFGSADADWALERLAARDPSAFGGWRWSGTARRFWRLTVDGVEAIGARQAAAALGLPGDADWADVLDELNAGPEERAR